MIETNNISFYPFGDFLIARVAVPGAFLRGDKPYKKKANIACPQGYKLYYSLDGKELKIYNNEVKHDKGDPLNKAEELYIYCIKERIENISIPFGVAKTETYDGYHFIISVSCDENNEHFVPEKILGGYFMRNAWNYTEKDDLIYEYISEFFINEEHRMGGLSIALRDEFSEIFKLFLSDNNRYDAIRKSIDKLNGKYEGFKFSNGAIEVKA